MSNFQAEDGTPALPMSHPASPRADLPTTRSCCAAFPEPPRKQPSKLKHLAARTSQVPTLLLQPEEQSKRGTGGFVGALQRADRQTYTLGHASGASRSKALEVEMKTCIQWGQEIR